MNFKQLKNVLQIAKNGSITKAAQELYISQQTLSESVKLLEEELGFKIFARSNKGVELTEKGEIFINDAQNIIQYQRKWQEMAEKNQVIHLAIFYVLNDLIINENLTELLQNISGIETMIDTIRTSESISYLAGDANNAVLAAITPRSPVCQKLSDFCAKNGYEILTICEDEFCLLLNKNNPLAQKEKIDPKEMVGLQFTANTYFASLLSVKESAKATKRAILQLPPTVNIPQYLAHHENNVACFLKKSVQSSEYVQNGVLVLKDYTFEDGENAKYQYIYHRGNKAAEKVGEYLKEYFAKKIMHESALFLNIATG